MSFIGEVEQGKFYAPGWFLAHAECERETREIPQTGAETADNGGKYVKAGTFWGDTSDGDVGLVYEDVDVTTGDMPGSVVTKGTVYLDRLPTALTSTQQEALEAKGFVFIETAPEVERPIWTND